MSKPPLELPRRVCAHTGLFPSPARRVLSAAGEKSWRSLAQQWAPTCLEHRAPGAGTNVGPLGGTLCSGSCSLWGPAGMKLVWVGRGSMGITKALGKRLSLSGALSRWSPVAATRGRWGAGKWSAGSNKKTIQLSSLGDVPDAASLQQHGQVAESSAHAEFSAFTQMAPPNKQPARPCDGHGQICGRQVVRHLFSLPGPVPVAGGMRGTPLTGCSAPAPRGRLLHPLAAACPCSARWGHWLSVKTGTLVPGSLA